MSMVNELTQAFLQSFPVTLQAMVNAALEKRGMTWEQCAITPFQNGWHEIRSPDGTSLMIWKYPECVEVKPGVWEMRFRMKPPFNQDPTCRYEGQNELL